MAKKLFKKFTWKKLLSVLLAIITFAGAIFGLVKLGNYLKEDHKKQISNFDRGGLDENTGDYIKTNKSIYTKNSFSAKGLEIKLDFDSNVSYQVFWYDELGEFSHCSEVMTKGSKFYTPYKHEARIVITPQWETGASEDEKEIKWHEVSKYANQLTISVFKNQSVTEKDFTKYKLNDSIFTLHVDKRVEMSTGELIDAAGANMTTVSLQNNGNFSALYFNKLAETAVSVHFVSKSGDVIDCYSNTYENCKPLPSYDSLAEIPADAIIYIYGQFLDLENTVVSIY